MATNLKIPADIRDILADHKGEESYFANLSPSHKKEYIEWINSAKKPETRAARIAKMISMLSESLQK